MENINEVEKEFHRKIRFHMLLRKIQERENRQILYIFLKRFCFKFWNSDSLKKVWSYQKLRLYKKFPSFRDYNVDWYDIILRKFSKLYPFDQIKALSIVIPINVCPVNALSTMKDHTLSWGLG